MALRILNPGIPCLGQFDAIDHDSLLILGGEVAGLTFVATEASGGTDESAADIEDGYVTSNLTRPAATTTLVANMRPLFLTDDGTTNYGTLFGEVVGGLAGQTVTGGAALGPHTATGSGKWTLWDKPGLYAVTLDAVDTTINSGLLPTNPALAGGDPLFATAAGLLTPNGAASFDGVDTTVVGRFIEFATDGSLVTTPRSLTQAVNSPPGAGAPQADFFEAVFHFRIE